MRKIVKQAPETALACFVGERIKRQRIRRGYSLRDLASLASVSAAMISEVERGKKSPTITLLTAIATALAVPASYLFEHDRPLDGVAVVRKKDHRVVPVGPGLTNVILGHPISGSNLHFVRLHLRAGAGRDPSSHPPGSIERAHVAEGSISLTVGGETVRLRAGDSCSFDGERPHVYRNTGRTTAKVYLVVEFGQE